MKDYACVLISDNHTWRNPWGRSAGPYRLKTHLNNHQLSTKLVDCAFYFEAEELVTLLTSIIGPSTKLVAFSSTFMYFRENPVVASAFEMGIITEDVHRITRSWKWVVEVIAGLRRACPHVKIAVGGANATNFPGQYDYVLTGYGEESLTQLLLELNAGRTPLNKRIEGTDHFGAEWDIHYEADDFMFPGESLTVEVSRGCRFKCKFCNFPLNGRKINNYWRDAQTLREELLRNFELHGTLNYLLADDTFNETPEKVELFTKAFQSLPFSDRLSMFSYLRGELVMKDPQTLSMLKDSPIRFLNFGLESVDKRNLSLVGKGFGGQETFDFIENMAELYSDRIVSFNFIAGLPYDTHESVEALKQKLSDIRKPNVIYNFNPLHISADPNKRYKSAFDDDFAKYGYTISREPAKYGLHPWWTNKMGYTQIQAFEDSLFPRMRGMSTMLSVVATGYDIDKEFMAMFRMDNEHHVRHFLSLADVRRKKYVDQLIAWSRQ